VIESPPPRPGFAAHDDGGASSGPQRPARVGDLTAGSLPDDVLAEAAARVFRLALVAVVFFGVALALLLLQPAKVATGAPRWPLAALGLLAAGGSALWLRFGRAPPDVQVDLGLAGHIIGGLLLAVIELPRYTGGDVHLNGISSLVVWQLLFPGLVPQPARRIALAAAAISVAPPISAALAGLRGHVIDTGALALSTFPVVAAGFVGFAMSRILYNLGRKVAEARRIGSYELETPLGKGGMGEVWRARHRLLARPAAIKLIRPDKLVAGTALESLASFEREAQATAQLRSPHTIELYDYGVADDGRFYYAMELLDGIDLQDLVAQHGAVPPARAIAILRQIALSLGEAHHRGLVHRDVSPRNVFLCRQGTSFDVVKVLDFGLVAAVETPASRNDGELIVHGTPMNIAPETLRGEPTDPRSDLYALGHVGFWLLTGGVAFVAQTRAAYYDAHLEQEPRTPSEVAGREIPADLEAVIRGLIAREPADRPTHAAAVIEALDGCADADAWGRSDAVAWWAER